MERSYEQKEIPDKKRVTWYRRDSYPDHRTYCETPRHIAQLKEATHVVVVQPANPMGLTPVRDLWSRGIVRVEEEEVIAMCLQCMTDFANLYSARIEENCAA